MSVDDGHPKDNNNGALQYDVFRDSPLRYAGYANEVGESFRYQFPRFVIPSYGISGLYVIADAISKGHDAWQEYPTRQQQQQQQQQPTSDKTTTISRTMLTCLHTMDTLIWQSLASVFIPGATINLIVKASRFAVARSPVVLGAVVKEWLPTATGLGSIPLIIHPIDDAVHALLDNTTRKWFAEEQWEK